MAPVPKHGTVAVTGAAGFIAGHAVKQLLDKGYRVRACVRNPDDDARVGFLKTMPGHASGRLTLFKADLDQAGSFDAAFKGAHGVLHISHVTGYDDANYVRGVCEHLIASITAGKTVSRVIVTSSIAAVMSEADIQELVRRPVICEDRWPDELNPRRTAERGQGYSIGKVLAERVFADAAAKDGGFDAIACCPGDNVGPILSAHQQTGGPWQSLIARMLKGEYPQTLVYRPWMTVDARDTAAAHIGLLESLSVKNGERYVAASGDKRNVEDVCASISRLLPELNFAGATLTDPYSERIKAREAEFRSIWAGTEIRNDRVRAATGMTFRPLDESIRDCVESLIAVGKVEVKRRAG
jgi:bifunctional dihydroflavonol 4-reductase/flavanone 4-reductase